MNDKNFIEELRQKREEYGVTQTRLAVACGISREYYNRIEKGKQPLNDELREIIEKQIERFNPQEPLFLLIDYFRVRFPTTDALAIIRDVLQLKSNYMLYEDYGKYGYESKYVLGDINIMCSMQEHLGVLLELKGKGCRQMECYLLAQERSWYDFMLDCMTAGGVMKRLDLAINDKAGILDIPKLKEKYKAGECISYFRMQKDYSGTEKCGSDLPKNTGETLYLGSTSSELYMCAYQKNYEQYVKNGTEIEDTEIKNRFEIRMKNERAYYAVVDLLTYRDAERTAFSIINHYVRFVDREDDKPKEINVTTQTFNEAYTLAESGDILLMSSGTYNKQISFPSDKSITLKAEKNAEVVITFDITGNDDTSENGGGLIFDGVKINRSADYFISGNFVNAEFKIIDVKSLYFISVEVEKNKTVRVVRNKSCGIGFKIIVINITRYRLVTYLYA